MLKATRQSSPYTVLTQESTGATRVYTFTGLTNGVAYKMSVAAVNAAGVSDYSALSDTFTPAAGYPGVPTHVTGAIYSTTSIDVSWTAPEDNGGADITNYTVYAYANNSIFPTSSQNVGSAATTRRYTGLTTGTPYYFKVAAWTSATGGGPTSQRSLPSGNITPCGATNQPGAPTGEGGFQSVSLYWTAPSDLQGSVVEYYQVALLDSSGNPLGIVVDTPNADLAFRIGGLENGVGKKFKVRSVTTGGFTSAYGGNSATITPTATPSQPTPNAPRTLAADYTGIDAAVGKGVHLTWVVPLTTGAPSQYVVARRPAGSDYEYAVIKNVPGNVLECVINDGDLTPGVATIDIPNGTEYEYVVYAYDSGAAGSTTGPPSNAVTFAAASSPTWNPLSGGLTVTKAGVGELAISWDAAQDNGSGITEYRLYASPTTTPSSSYLTLPKEPRASTLKALDIQPTYIWLKAVNEVGASDFVDPGIVETPLENAGTYTPDAPIITSVRNYKDSVTGSLGATIEFTTDASPGSHIITATATKVSDGSETVVSPFDLIFPGLEAGEEYTFTIYDTYEGVESDYSNPSAPLLISDIPAKISPAPTIESVGDREVTISWTAPDSDKEIQVYNIIVTTNGQNIGEYTSGTTTYKISGLDNGTAYQFSVRALNGVEGSTGYTSQEYSDFSDPAVPTNGLGINEVAPDTPTDTPVATPLDGSVTISWTYTGSPGSQNDIPTSITKYRVYYRVHGSGSYTQAGEVLLNTIGYDLGGLTNGTEYDFVYTAINGNPEENESGFSPVVSATPVSSPGDLPPGPPNPPLTSTYDATSYYDTPGYTLEWGSPSTGEPALSYTVKYNIKLAGGSGSDYIYTHTGVVGQTLVLPAADFEYGIYQFSVQSVGLGGASEPVYSDVF
jgi:hypothetical protein